ncbi:MAG: ABC transporter permease [Desulfotomaculum sp.]|nr:ABC transporter permease [Desulfotomaculum sp.]
MIEANPVLLKELRQRFRNYKAPLIFFIYLLVIGGFILAAMYLDWRHFPSTFNPSRSREIFIVLSLVQLIMLAFVTPGLTAGTISGERERQTLNVLLTTDLTPGGIVISKMISSCSFTLLLLVSTLPLYSIVLIYGGISPWQLLAVFSFYVVTMFLFAAIGMASSAFFRRTGVSTVTSYAVTAFLLAGTAFLAMFIYEVTVSNVYPRPDTLPAAAQLLLDINPVVVLMCILGEGPMLDKHADWFLPYWLIYTLFYLISGLILLWWGSLRLNPLRKKSNY